MVFVSDENSDTHILKFNICDVLVRDTIYLTKKFQFNGDKYSIEPEGPQTLKKNKNNCIRKILENNDLRLIFSDGY